MLKMADDFFPLILLAGAGYLYWKYMSPTPTSSAVSIPPPATQPTAPLQSYYNPAMSVQFASVSAAPAQVRPAPNPYWNPGGPQTQNPAPFVYDTSHLLDKPAPAVIGNQNPSNLPPLQVWAPGAYDFFNRCTYITGAVIPGCV